MFSNFCVCVGRLQVLSRLCATLHWRSIVMAESFATILSAVSILLPLKTPCAICLRRSKAEASSIYAVARLCEQGEPITVGWHHLVASQVRRGRRGQARAGRSRNASEDLLWRRVLRPCVTRRPTLMSKYRRRPFPLLRGAPTHRRDLAR